MALAPSEFTNSVTPQVAPLAQPIAGAGSEITKAVGGLGDTLFGAGEQRANAQQQVLQLQHEQEVNQQTTAGAVAFAQLRADMAAKVSDLRQNAAPGGAGHLDAVAQAYDPAVDQLMQGITNPVVRQHMIGQLAGYGAELRTTEAAWQTGEGLKQQALDGDQASDISANMAMSMTDPKAIAAEVGRWSATVDAMHGSDDFRDKARRAGASKILQAAIQGAVNRGDLALANSLLGSDAAQQAIDPTKMEVLSGGVRVEQRRLDAQAREQKALADKAVREQISTHLMQVSQGIQVPDAVLAADQASRAASGDTSGAQEIAGIRAKSAINATTQPWAPQQYDQRIAALAAKGTARSPAEDVELTQLRQIAPERVQQVRNDPYAWSASNGHAPAPLDIKNPATIAARQQLQGTIQAATGIRPPLMTPDEAAPLKAQWQQGDKGRAGVIDTLASLGPAAGLDALHQIAPDDATARRLLVLPQSYRSLAIDGATARKANKNLVDGPNAAGQIGTAQQSSTYFAQHVGPALMLLNPADRMAALDTARSIQAGFQFHNGTGYTDTQFYGAIHQALGGTRDASGVYRGGIGEWQGKPVLMPDGVSSQQFQQHMANLHFGAQWAATSPTAPVFRGGQAMTADQIKSGYTPVIRPDGRYQFMGPPVPGTASPSVIHRRDGQVWTVKIDGGGLHP